MHRIFITPELVSIICADIPPQSMLVSKHFFHGMLPYRWKSVSVSALFTRGLIPADCTRQGATIRAFIHEQLTPENMSRFHFYAPFIKKLSFDSYFDSVELVSWEPLINYSQKTEILPNLVEFVCWKADLHPLYVFTSGSTELIYFFGSLDVPLVGKLLTHVAKKSPRVRELQFYSESSHLIDSINAIPPQAFDPLSTFHNLRRLTSSTEILHSHALNPLAQLPNLTELQIEDYYSSGPSLLLREQLPAGSFPSLGTLYIDFGTPHDVKKFWELVPLKALNKVHISIQSTKHTDQLLFIASLCQGSPRIRELGINFSEEPEDDEDIYNLQADTFEYLGRLPLDRSLSLGSAKLEFDDAWNRITMFWPDLREFRCIHQTMRLKDLKLLSASLPNLCRLECDFDLANAASVIEPGWQPTGHPPFYPNLHELTIKSFDLKESVRADQARGLSDLARTFAYFWPNVQICWDAPDDMSEVDHYSCQEAMFDVFKQLIKAHAHAFHNV
ncbi:hypothetical protein FRC08_010270 [Ceratobasidium sp. 394]|nr:hypothetical protein FRC08_010270 [Ceratobasidium sp. 394]